MTDITEEPIEQPTEEPIEQPTEKPKKSKRKYTISDKVKERIDRAHKASVQVSKERKNIHNDYKRLVKEQEEEQKGRELEELDIPILKKKQEIYTETTTQQIEDLTKKIEHLNKVNAKLKNIINEMMEIDRKYLQDKTWEIKDIEKAVYQTRNFGGGLIIPSRYDDIKNKLNNPFYGLV